MIGNSVMSKKKPTLLFKFGLMKKLPIAIPWSALRQKIMLIKKHCLVILVKKVLNQSKNYLNIQFGSRQIQLILTNHEPLVIFKKTIAEKNTKSLKKQVITLEVKK